MQFTTHKSTHWEGLFLDLDFSYFFFSTQVISDAIYVEYSVGWVGVYKMVYV